MIVIVLDKDREDLECYQEGDASLFEDALSIGYVFIYKDGKVKKCVPS